MERFTAALAFVATSHGSPRYKIKAHLLHVEVSEDRPSLGVLRIKSNRFFDTGFYIREPFEVDGDLIPVVTQDAVVGIDAVRRPALGLH